MRDLTAEELALAPEWATHYYILSDDLIQFESELHYVKVNSKTKNSSKVQCNKEYGVAGVKIPFDITKHEFYDCEVKLESVCKHLICFEVSNKYPEFNKKDIIAAAKALGVTGDDIK